MTPAVPVYQETEVEVPRIMNAGNESVSNRNYFMVALKQNGL